MIARARRAQLGVAVLVGLVVVAMLLSSAQMADLRVALPPLSNAMNWLEFLPLPFDMDHVVFFALVACALRLLLPRVRWWWLLLGLGALAVGTELLQFASDGRTPKLQDVRDDMVGAALGLGVGALLLAIARWVWRWKWKRRVSIGRQS